MSDIINTEELLKAHPEWYEGSGFSLFVPKKCVVCGITNEQKPVSVWINNNGVYTCGKCYVPNEQKTVPEKILKVLKMLNHPMLVQVSDKLNYPDIFEGFKFIKKSTLTGIYLRISNDLYLDMTPDDILKKYG